MPKANGAVATSIKDSERWQVERDLETLMECERIEKDPKRMAKVRALAKEKMLAVAPVAAGDS